jgi:hypothetical protein
LSAAISRCAARSTFLHRPAQVQQGLTLHASGG